MRVLLKGCFLRSKLVFFACVMSGSFSFAAPPPAPPPGHHDWDHNRHDWDRHDWNHHGDFRLQIGVNPYYGYGYGYHYPYRVYPYSYPYYVPPIPAEPVYYYAPYAGCYGWAGYHYFYHHGVGGSGIVCTPSL